MLAGAVFAEADPKPESNGEREGIAWSFVNSFRHTIDLCDGTLECPEGTRAAGRALVCRIDRRDLGATLESAIKVGSVAFDSPRWNLVMSGMEMLDAKALCKLPADERRALKLAITAAWDVFDSKNEVDFFRFNRANDSPPGDRFERSARINGHTFYRFKAGRQCG
jgi:hypothetical protein